MADYRRQVDRHSWFDDRNSRYEHDRPASEHDERDSRWEAGGDERPYGTYRTDDRGYHDRFRESYGRDDAANDYYRAARDQRDDYLRWSAQNMGVWGDQSHHFGEESMPAWMRRERGGYWRQYEANRPHMIGRGPKGYQRSDDRIREDLCDRMTDDPILDASEIEIDVRQGEVTLTGLVTSRDQKRRAEDIAECVGGVRDVTNQLRVTRDGGHSSASSQPVSEASRKETPGKSTSGSTA